MDNILKLKCSDIAFGAADICKKCAICEEETSMKADDYRAQGIFICNKCKSAVLHIREFLENGGCCT